MIATIFFATAAAADHGGAWVEFSRAGALSHVEETVAIETGRVTRDDFEYRLVYTRTMLRGTETRTTSSATCPAVRPLVRSLRGVTMPRPAPYGVPGDARPMILDGISYSLRAPSNFSNGELTITSNIGSPLASWVDGAFTALSACWSAAR